MQQILAGLQAGGGGDAPEGVTQALWMAATGGPYEVTLGGYWQSEQPSCSDPNMLGMPCFRPNKLPIFVLITDSSFHNGPIKDFDYDTSIAGGVRTYDETVAAIQAIGGKVLGVPVNTGMPARREPICETWREDRQQVLRLRIRRRREGSGELVGYREWAGIHGGGATSRIACGAGASERDHGEGELRLCGRGGLHGGREGRSRVPQPRGGACDGAL